MIPSIFLVIGPPAVGKRTTSRALAARFPQSLHIPVDDLREMVVSGRVLPGPEWPEALVEQIRLVREAAIEMAQRYHAAEFVVVMDDFFDPNRLREYQILRDQPYFHRILLLPDQGIAHARNFQRAGEGSNRDNIDVGIRQVYEEIAPVLEDLQQEGWLILDTTAL